MLNPADLASIQPVTRIMPLLAVDNIGSTTQELSDRAAQFVKGQTYLAHVGAKVGSTTFNVKVETASPQGMMLKMDLGAAGQTGQTLSLRYMSDGAIPSFMLMPTPSKSAVSSSELSPAAQMIDHYIKEAEGEGGATRLEATTVVTQTPKNTQVLAHDLNQAVSNSGLFYESHLSEMVQGTRSLATIMQEPQNQNNPPIATLMSQQLAVLENQRMAWHGEVWPGQKMDWDVYLQQKNTSRDDTPEPRTSDGADESRPIASEMTLHLPRLGKVSAKLLLVDGRMRISIQADQAETLYALKNQRQSLAEAVTKNGQQLDALTVTRHE